MKVPTVTLRAKKLKDRYSLYIDIYYGKGKRKIDTLNRYVSKDYTKYPGRVLAQDKLSWEAANEIWHLRKIEIQSKGLSFEKINTKDKSFLKHLDKTVKDKANASYEGALYQLNLFLEKTGRDDLLISDLKEELLKELKDFLLANCSPNTASQYINRYIISFKLLKSGMDNPFREIGNIKIPDRQTIFLTESQIQKLAKTPCDAISKVDKLAFLFACYTGFRYSDCFSLTWGQVKEYEIVKRTKKSQKVKTVRIPRHQTINAILDKMDRGTEKVFHDMSKNSPINEKVRIWAKAAEIKLDAPLTFHVSRHSFITNLARSGANIVTVQRLAGHAKIEQTLKYYTNTREDRENAIKHFKGIDI